MTAPVLQRHRRAAAEALNSYGYILGGPGIGDLIAQAIADAELAELLRAIAVTANHGSDSGLAELCRVRIDDVDAWWEDGIGLGDPSEEDLKRLALKGWGK